MSSITLNNVSLDYILKTGNLSLKQSLLSTVKTGFNKKKNNIKHSTYRALKNITLSIEHGDRIGLIGQNGAGKTTLLRVLAGIYHPAEGSIKVDGHVFSLLDLSLGMNPEATGYENIILLGMLRGKTKAEMRKQCADIEAFTELGGFLNAPVRTYSSGMTLRLTFGTITSIEPDILLLDEIIGVGDASFIKKAQKRLNDLIDKSNILVISSHANDIIRQLCNKTVVLNNGDIKFFGDVEKGLDFYESMIKH